MNYFITADRVGVETGGGTVTKHEWAALQTLGPAERISRDELGEQPDPWGWDDRACYWKDWHTTQPKLAHLYSGTFGRTVERLRWNGCKISYTIAAHDREISRREHEQLGMSFPYDHLTNPLLWKRYIEGYRLADVIVTPSTVSEKTIRAYGKDFETKKMVVIPHGVEFPGMIKPLPDKFVVGYMGSLGADKGVRYLLSAWKKLNLKDATLLLGGRDSGTPFARQMVQMFGGGNIQLLGWQKNPSDFYNQLSLYIQPSATEGFGLECLEALAHTRPVICSDGAGAVDCITEEVGMRVKATDVDALASAIQWYQRNPDKLLEARGYSTGVAMQYTWDKIQQRYIDLWKTLV